MGWPTADRIEARVACGARGILSAKRAAGEDSATWRPGCAGECGSSIWVLELHVDLDDSLSKKILCLI